MTPTTDATEPRRRQRTIHRALVRSAGERLTATRSVRRMVGTAVARLGGYGGCIPLLVLIGSLAARGPAVAQTCVGDCDGDGTVEINELILGVNIALDVFAISQCPSLDDGQGRVTVDRLIVAVNNALNGCEGGTPTPTQTGAAMTPTVTPTGEVVTMWIVDDYQVTSSDCSGVIEDQVVNALEAFGPNFTVRQSGDQVEIDDGHGNVFVGTADPDGTVHVQRTISDSIVTCDYDVAVDASADLTTSPTTATHDADVNLSGFCLGFSDCSLQITSRWRRVQG